MISGAPTQVSINATGGNGPLTYSWRQISGTTATLSNTKGAILGVITPKVTAPEVLSFELTVSDTVGNTATGIALVAVQVQSIANPPVVVTVPSATTPVTILDPATGKLIAVETLGLSYAASGQVIPIQGFGSDVASVVLTQTAGRTGGAITKISDKEWSYKAPTITVNYESIELSVQMNYANGAKKTLLLPVQVLGLHPPRSCRR